MDRRVRHIVHIDMDAFFASVEQLDHPELRGKPVLVGGRSRRGVVAAASYEARAFGARSAMPMYAALRLCRDAIVVAPRHDRYVEVSNSIFDVFRRFTPLVEGLSVDEAFLDVTDSCALFGTGEALGRRIKDDVYAQTGLRASAGIAPCKFVAKIASDLRKPDGLVVVAPSEVEAFLAPLPIERMWGIGPKTAPKVRSAGVATLGDLARADMETLEPLLGRWAKEAQLLARGIDDRPVEPDREAKSYGAEETYERDLVQLEDIERCLLDQSVRVAERLARDRLAGRTVTIKLKLHDFRLITRRCTLPEPVSTTDRIFAAAKHLLKHLPPLAPVRLTGVSVGALEASSAPAPELFGEAAPGRARRLEEVSAKIHDKFGQRAMTRAALLAPHPGGPPEMPSVAGPVAKDPPDATHITPSGAHRARRPR